MYIYCLIVLPFIAVDFSFYVLSFFFIVLVYCGRFREIRRDYGRLQEIAGDYFWVGLLNCLNLTYINVVGLHNGKLCQSICAWARSRQPIGDKLVIGFCQFDQKHCDPVRFSAKHVWNLAINSRSELKYQHPKRGPTRTASSFHTSSQARHMGFCTECCRFQLCRSANWPAPLEVSKSLGALSAWLSEDPIHDVCVAAWMMIMPK